jgi:hypothetical protein
VISKTTFKGSKNSMANLHIRGLRGRPVGALYFMEALNERELTTCARDISDRPHPSFSFAALDFACPFFFF